MELVAMSAVGVAGIYCVCPPTRQCFISRADSHRPQQQLQQQQQPGAGDGDANAVVVLTGDKISPSPAPPRAEPKVVRWTVMGNI